MSENTEYSVIDCPDCMGTGIKSGYPGPSPCRTCHNYEGVGKILAPLEKNQESEGVDKSVRQECHILNENSEANFQNEANILMERGWTLQSSSCGYIPDPYDACFFIGIFVREFKKPYKLNSGQKS